MHKNTDILCNYFIFRYTRTYIDITLYLYKYRTSKLPLYNINACACIAIIYNLYQYIY